MGKKKRTKRISIALGTAAVLLLCLSCAGCSEKKAEEWTLTPTSTPSTGAIIEVTPTLHRAYPQGDPSPLEIERDYSAYDEGYVLYPKVISGNYADKINNTICGRVLESAAKQQVQIFTEYRIETNSNGIFSIMLFIRDLNSNELLDQLPMTFDTASGELCLIDYFFDANSNEWREALSAEVERVARENGLSLLGKIPPVENTQSYYLTDKALVLQYKLYEISTYAAGCPEIEIPMEKMKTYLAPESPLLRVLNEVN